MPEESQTGWDTCECSQNLGIKQSRYHMSARRNLSGIEMDNEIGNKRHCPAGKRNDEPQPNPSRDEDDTKDDEERVWARRLYVRQRNR